MASRKKTSQLTKSNGSGRGFIPRVGKLSRDSVNAPILTQAEGRSLNSKNVDRLLALSKQLEAGGQTIAAILEEAGIDTSAASEEAIAAGAITDEFIEWVQECTWYNRLQILLSIFSHSFSHVCKQKREELPELLDALREMLLSLANDAQTGEEDEETASLMSASAGRQAIQIEMPIEIEASGIDNNVPVRGVLFRVDEVSENVPAVGAGYPVYVSRQVAMEAIHQASGLPIDASEDLTDHDNDGIVGVMSSAEIDGLDFVIQGRLWGWSNPEKVTKIRAKAKERLLGMSMSGVTWGEIVTMEGRQVYSVSRLKLLGGCILLKSHATYEKTNVIAASTEPSPVKLAEAALGAKPIAASNNTATSTTTTQQTMTPEQEQKLNNVSTAVESLTSVVGEIKSYIEAQRKQEQEAATLQQQQSQQQQQRAEIEKVVEEALKRANQSSAARQPIQLTRSLGVVAPAAPEETPTMLTLAHLKGKLEALEGRYDSASRVQRIALSDQIAALSAQLQE